MKARINNKNQRKIVAANIPEDKFSAINELCGNDIKMITCVDGKAVIGQILGEDISCSDTKTYPSADNEMLLFAGFDRTELNKFLDRLKSNDLKVSLKAVYTVHNRSWSVDHLISDLKAEHKQMTGGEA